MGTAPFTRRVVGLLALGIAPLVLASCMSGPNLQFSKRYPNGLIGISFDVWVDVSGPIFVDVTGSDCDLVFPTSNQTMTLWDQSPTPHGFVAVGRVNANRSLRIDLRTDRTGCAVYYTVVNGAQYGSLSVTKF